MCVYYSHAFVSMVYTHVYIHACLLMYTDQYSEYGVRTVRDPSERGLLV